MNNIHAEVDEILRTGNKKAIVSLFLSMQGNYIRATEAEAKLAKAQADADHWKSECSALQRMVHEARTEIERKDKLIEQMREAIKFSLIADEVRQTRNVCASDINDACETSRVKRIAALAAEMRE